jgi:hypothetical protein
MKSQIAPDPYTPIVYGEGESPIALKYASTGPDVSALGAS